MFLIEGAGRIPGEVALEIFQAQIEFTVEHLAQPVQQRQILVASRRQTGIQPLNMVATHPFAHLLARATTDAGRGQITLRGTFAALIDQFEGQSLRCEQRLQRPALFGQVVDDAR
ncbi:hypothetical protein D3C72_1943720 [compost metagenome]